MTLKKEIQRYCPCGARLVDGPLGWYRCVYCDKTYAPEDASLVQAPDGGWLPQMMALLENLQVISPREIRSAMVDNHLLRLLFIRRIQELLGRCEKGEKDQGSLGR